MARKRQRNPEGGGQEHSAPEDRRLRRLVERDLNRGREPGDWDEADVLREIARLRQRAQEKQR